MELKGSILGSDDILFLYLVAGYTGVFFCEQAIHLSFVQFYVCMLHVNGKLT